jgi:hypothetical protein
MFDRGIVRVWFRLSRLRDCLFQPSQLDLSFVNPIHGVVAQCVFHSFSLLQATRLRAEAGSRT